MTDSASSWFDRFGALARLIRRAYKGYTKELAVLITFGFFGGVLEGIGINAVIPLLSFLLDTTSVPLDQISVWIRVLFDFLGVDFAPKFLLIFIVLVFLARSAVLLLLYYTQINIVTKYESDMRTKLYAAVMRSSWTALMRQKMGHLETWLLVDVPASVNVLRNVNSAIMLLTSLVIYLIVAFNISPPVMFITLGFGVVMLLVLRPIALRVREYSARRAATYSEMTHQISESVSGLKSIKAGGVEERMVAAGSALFEKTRQLSARVMLFYQLTNLGIPPIGVVYLAAIFAAAYRTQFVSLAALPAVMYLIYRIAIYVQQMQSSIQNMNEFAPHLQRMLAYTERAEDSKEERNGSKSFSFEKELRFTNVSFAYADAPVIRDVSFVIRRGEFVGIVGPSGAGKTTCIDLILRLLTPQSGSITLDGTQIQSISLAEWRKHIGYVSQDLFLVNDTVRNNIAFYDSSISDEKIWEVARMAHIDGLIQRLPDGLDTVLSDRGGSLSAGERQRLIIARALARDLRVLILDEATSALDSESEAHIKGILDGLKGKLTIIAIAHRLSTIMDADTLFAFEDGSLVEQGSPEKLLKDKDSYFYKVYSIS